MSKTPVQIKSSEIPKFRSYFAKKQSYDCPLCSEKLSLRKQALDHCHTTGKLRGTLHADCNRCEGKVREGAKFMTKITHLSRTDLLQFLKNMVKYLEDSEANPSHWIHPSFDLETGKQKPKKRRPRSKK
ncbi:MAG: hypothetical protein KAG37_03980 [Flavobacteriales bacterium]|nr:hypothetical protein [Flavobacteriales bacterium]